MDLQTSSCCSSFQSPIINRHSAILNVSSVHITTRAETDIGHIDYATELNEQQLAAVTAPLGPLLVIAGAASFLDRITTSLPVVTFFLSATIVVIAWLQWRVVRNKLRLDEGERGFSGQRESNPHSQLGRLELYH